MTTTRDHTDRRTGAPASPPLVDRSRPTGAGFDPLRAWRLHALYAPIADAVLGVLAAAGGVTPARVLLVGGHREPFELLLGAVRAHARESRTIEVVHVAAGDSALAALEPASCDCVAAVDWLPLVGPSHREEEVVRLCRASRSGLVLLNPFDAPEVAAAERAVSALYRSVHGSDHPSLGRHAELGLPDLDAVRRWVEPLFSFVETRSVERIASWQAAESLVAGGPEPLAMPAAADVAAAVAYPVAPEMDPVEPSYRKLLVAAAQPVALGARRLSSAVPVGGADVVAFTMHAALEAAGQRRALDRLVEVTTVERERERQEFRDAVASLAVEVRDLEAHAEALARETEDRGRVIGNQHAAIADTEKHVANLEAALERAREDQALTAVHIRNVEAARTIAEQRTAEADARLAEADARLAEADAQLAEAEGRIAKAEARIAEAQARLAEADERRAALEREAAAATEHARFMEEVHTQFLESRAGRAFNAYLRVKRSVLGRS